MTRTKAENIKVFIHAERIGWINNREYYYKTFRDFSELQDWMFDSMHVPINGYYVCKDIGDERRYYMDFKLPGATIHTLGKFHDTTESGMIQFFPNGDNVVPIITIEIIENDKGILYERDRYCSSCVKNFIKDCLRRRDMKKMYVDA